MSVSCLSSERGSFFMLLSAAEYVKKSCKSDLSTWGIKFTSCSTRDDSNSNRYHFFFFFFWKNECDSSKYTCVHWFPALTAKTSSVLGYILFCCNLTLIERRAIELLFGFAITNSKISLVSLTTSSLTKVVILCLLSEINVCACQMETASFFLSWRRQQMRLNQTMLVCFLSAASYLSELTYATRSDFVKHIAFIYQKLFLFVRKRQVKRYSFWNCSYNSYCL